MKLQWWWRLTGALGLALVVAVPAALAADGDDSDAPLDTVSRLKAGGVLSVCSDPYEYPHAEQNADPPGFDIEILRAIARRNGFRLDMVWVNTASRGGTARAFRQSILAKKCDVFIGMSDSGDDDMLMGKLTFTKPYLGMGYVLVVQGKAEDKKSLDDFKDGEMKVGVTMSTPMDDYLFMNKIPRDMFMGTKRMMDAFTKGEIDAAMMFSTSLAVARIEYPKTKVHMVQGYQPAEGLRYNAAWVVRKDDKTLLKFINDNLDEMLANGRIKEIVEQYGVPFYDPFNS